LVGFLIPYINANFPHHFNSDTSTATALIFDTGFVPALIA
jgi:hypothetical protein